MKLFELLKALGDQVKTITPAPSGDHENTTVQSIHYDSRTVTPGGLFVAITGYQSDGHDFIEQSIERGAVALLVDRDVTASKENPLVTTIQVADTRQGLAVLAAHFYGYPSREMVVIGLTGTNGKTTTSYLIEKMLEAAGYKVGVIGTISYRFGETAIDAPVTTPEALDLQRIFRQMCDHKVTHVVMEASSHALALHRIDGCELDVAVFTNLTQDHLDFHKDMIGYWDTKKKLFTDVLQTGTKKRSARAVINRDDPRGDMLAQELDVPVVTVGRGDDNLVRPLKVVIGPGGIDGTLSLQTVKKQHDGYPAQFDFHSPLAGEFNLENILCAAGACAAISVKPNAIQAGIEQIGSVPGRLERVENNAGLYVYVDYAHTPDALKNALMTLKRVAEGRLICVAGCGGDRDRAKRPQMGRIAMMLSDLTILTSDNPRSEPPMAIIDDMLTGINNGYRPYKSDQLPGPEDRSGYVVEVDRRKAIRLGIDAAGPGDTVLIAGKGHETYQIIADQRIDFDDRKEAAEALARKATYKNNGHGNHEVTHCA